jgi:hypothetical protein
VVWNLGFEFFPELFRRDRLEALAALGFEKETKKRERADAGVFIREGDVAKGLGFDGVT